MPFNHKIILYEDTGRTRLIQCHSSAWISFEISGNKKLIVHFKHELIGKHFTETSNKVELRINRVRTNRVRPVYCF